MFTTDHTQRTDDLGGPTLSSASNGSQHQILVVEPIRSTRELLGTVLEGTYDIESVATYEEALRRVSSTHFDAILMSMNLTRVRTGTETLKRMRARSGYEDVPIIVFGGPSLDDEQERLGTAGGDEFLRMPFVRSELLDLLSRHVQGTEKRIEQEE